MKVNNTLKRLRLFNGCIAFLYLLAMLFLILRVGYGLLYEDSFASSTEEYISSLCCYGVSFLIIIALFTIYVFGAVRVKRQTKGNWIFQIVLVVIGFDSILTVIPAVWLFINLLSQEVQDYYKRGDINEGKRTEEN